MLGGRGVGVGGGAITKRQGFFYEEYLHPWNPVKRFGAGMFSDLLDPRCVDGLHGLVDFQKRTATWKRREREREG